MSELGRLLRDSIAAYVAEVHTCIPAVVQSYDPQKQTVTVQPAIARAIIDEDGLEAKETLPQIPDVPVVFPSGGGYYVTFPIAAGDTVLLVFSERPIDTWLAKGGTNNDPGDLRTHSLGDAFAIPCTRPTKDAFTDVSSDTMALGKQGGPQVHVDASTVALFSKTAADWVALASKVDAEITKIWNVINALTVPTALGPSGIPVGAPFNLKAPTGSTKVKAE